jgi:hypothetical protein
MKEFINHPQITRIFKPEIEKYGIKSIIMDSDEDVNIIQYLNSPGLPHELHHEIHWQIISENHEDEAFREAYEESYTINAAIESRKNR